MLCFVFAVSLCVCLSVGDVCLCVCVHAQHCASSPSVCTPEYLCSCVFASEFCEVVAGVY